MASRRSGALVGGRYRLQNPLDRGAFGEVWRAHDQGSGGALVAVKFLHERAAREPGVLARFRREAALAQRLGGPRIVRALDLGFLDPPPGFIVYEFLPGESLERRLERDGNIALDEALDLGCGLAEALSTAHAQGVVHRDLKPANMHLVEQNEHEFQVKLLDFGVARDRHDRASGPPLTSGDVTLGTLPYMAPEQTIDPAAADERADLYALGAVLFHALAGRPPFVARSAAALLALKTESEAPSLEQTSGLRPPAALESLLRRLLARDPAARLAAAPEALAVLQSLRHSLLSPARIP